MNRYPVWTYAVVLATVVLGLLYTLPNFYGEVPAVQLSSARATIKVDAGTLARVEDTLGKAGIKPTGLQLDSNSIKVRLTDTDTQLKAKDLISQALNSDPQAPSYTVALNLVSSSPAWLTAMHALPMYLGLDLRGGVPQRRCEGGRISSTDFSNWLAQTPVRFKGQSVCQIAFALARSAWHRRS